ncbi:HAD family hydrolase [Agromyces fucosus]|uniref:HAD family hydrolase n=1 Tax=Agromyces fucosus TaxID=41985 RepID=A0A4Q2JUR3_9MICO|nr:HAD family hydrolase [Agromyces fucosus]RXZ51074.1 HAD family hydrolase [Agromyces fucosus]
MTATAPPGPAAPVILFDLDDTLMAHRAAVTAGLALHMRDLAYGGDSAAASDHWHDLEGEHYHSYLAGRLTFEGQRRARARDFAIAHGEELDDLAAGAWFDRYFERYRASWSLHDDAVPALDALVRSLPDARFGIITNGELDFQLAKLERLGIRDRFEHVIASGDVGVTKPDPEIFRIALERFGLGTAIGRAAYIGDRFATDAVGAAEAGLIGVWLNRTGDDSAPDPKTSAVLEISSLAELPGLLAPLLAG